jgi:hypothetical protein
MVLRMFRNCLLTSLGGAAQSKQITCAVAGTRAIETVIDARRWHVMCCTAAIGPDVDENSTDSLWFLNGPCETELLALVTKLGRDLRVGGTRLGFEVLILSDHASSLRGVLLDNAFVPVRQQTGVEPCLFAGSQEPAPAQQAQVAWYNLWVVA